VTGVVVTALATGIGVAATVTYARLVRLRAADTCVIAASAALLPVVAWRSPGEYGRVLAGALLVAALVPALGGTTTGCGARPAGRSGWRALRP